MHFAKHAQLQMLLAIVIYVTNHMLILQKITALTPVLRLVQCIANKAIIKIKPNIKLFVQTVQETAQDVNMIQVTNLFSALIVMQLAATVTDIITMNALSATLLNICK